MMLGILVHPCSLFSRQSHEPLPDFAQLFDLLLFGCPLFSLSTSKTVMFLRGG